MILVSKLFSCIKLTQKSLKVSLQALVYLIISVAELISACNT